jgi:hypothetical protein
VHKLVHKPAHNQAHEVSGLSRPARFVARFATAVYLFQTFCVDYLDLAIVSGLIAKLQTLECSPMLVEPWQLQGMH